MHHAHPHPSLTHTPPHTARAHRTLEARRAKLLQALDRDKKEAQAAERQLVGLNNKIDDDKQRVDAQLEQLRCAALRLGAAAACPARRLAQRPACWHVLRTSCVPCIPAAPRASSPAFPRAQCAASLLWHGGVWPVGVEL